MTKRKAPAVFISHASEDKNLLHRTIELLGKNGIVVDEFTFESGERTEEEIELAINNSSVFVFLISRISISDRKVWIQKELAIIKGILEIKGDEKFVPLIIDESIDYKSPEIPKWIRDEYSLRDVFSNPVFLARKIQEEINKAKWNSYPRLRRREQMFIGRESDLANLRERYLRTNLAIRKGVVVSGRPDGIGRRRLLTELIREMDPGKKESYIPLSIDLQKDDSIEGFIIKLNCLLLLDKTEDLLHFLSTATRDEKLSKAVYYISHIIQKKEYLFIRDNNSIISIGGQIVDWFSFILEDKEINRVVFFIASKNRLTEAYDYPELANYGLEPLSKKSASMLLLSFLELDNKTISLEDEEFFISKTACMPALIAKCSDYIIDYGTIIARRQQRSYEYRDEELIKELIKDFRNDPDHIRLLVLLSEIDYLTIQQVHKICDGIIENVEGILWEMYSLSLYETFGSHNEFIKMNSVISDLVKRSGYNMDPQIWESLQLKVDEMICSESYEEADLGSLIKKIENDIKGDYRNINLHHIVPSIIMKLIHDEYIKKTKEGYNNVVSMCLKMKENSQNLFEDINKSVDYFLSVSYAQLKNESFFKHWNSLSQYQKLFIHGIYLRKIQQYIEAEDKFSKALEISPENYTAMNELAICLQRQNRYSDALTWAKQAYDKKPTNAFYIVTYFKSLVRENNIDTLLLEELIEKLNSTWDNKRKAFGEMLKAEREYFMNNDIDKAFDFYKSALSTALYPPIYISASEISKLAQRGDKLVELRRLFKLNW